MTRKVQKLVRGTLLPKRLREAVGESTSLRHHGGSMTCKYAPVVLLLSSLLCVAGCGQKPRPQEDAGAPACEVNADCPGAEECIAGTCVEPSECSDDFDCSVGEDCVMGECVSDDQPADAGDVRRDTPPEVEDTGPDIDCSGCLLTTGEGEKVCVDGMHDEACGTGGAACTECQSDEYCNQGSCEPADCVPSECSGCCRNDECMDGDTDMACGTGAETCETCSEGASCVNGSCQLPCSQRCDGCCDANGNCLSGNMKDSCGSGGESCTSCGMGMECNGGGCVQKMCDMNCRGCCGENQCKMGTKDSACGRDGEACKACAPGFACEQRPTGGVCALQDDSKWDVVAVRAEVPKTRKTYGQYGTKRDTKWDSFSKPDVELTVTVGTQNGEKSGSTNVVKDKRKPSWNSKTAEDVRADDLKATDNVTLSLVDSDVLADDLIAECTAEFESSEFDGMSYKFECTHSHAMEQITANVWLRVTPH